MSQQELARRAQISVPYAGRLERVEAAPGIDLLDRLARALEVSPADLMPTTAPQPLQLLRQQAESRFKTVLAKSDPATLMMLRETPGTPQQVNATMKIRFSLIYDRSLRSSKMHMVNNRDDFNVANIAHTFDDAIGNKEPQND